MSAPERTAERGMSLLELLVGVTILGLVALGVTSFLGNTVHQNKLSLQRSIAAGLASSRLHRLASMPYQPERDYEAYRLSGEAAAPGPPPRLSSGAGQLPGHPEFSRTVRLLYNQPNAGMMIARVDVYWHHHGGMQNLHTSVILLHPDLEELN